MWGWLWPVLYCAFSSNLQPNRLCKLYCQSISSSALRNWSRCRMGRSHGGVLKPQADRECRDELDRVCEINLSCGPSIVSNSDKVYGDRRHELTIRGLIIGVFITLVFTAANVYFGLKAGLTFSTSIPAAVISMAILRYFRDATVQENNIVQTVASAAGTLSSIIFVLPGLIMIGFWTEFPFWTSFWICALGGILGVMYSITLRRALVTQSDLPYPEVAALNDSG